MASYGYLWHLVKDLFKRHTLKEPKLSGQVVVSMFSSNTLVTGPLIIEKAKSFYDELEKVTRAHTLYHSHVPFV